MFKKSLFAAALVAASMSAALPAAAQGTLSLSLNATNAEEANAIRTGLTIYQIAQGAQSGAFVNQNGSLNGAAIAQVANGGSVGVIHQDGNGHNATLDQSCPPFAASRSNSCRSASSWRWRASSRPRPTTCRPVRPCSSGPSSPYRSSWAGSPTATNCTSG
jgi:opacity protein-like surface antigen